MDRRRFLAAVGSGVTLAVAGCLGQGQAAGDHDVGMTQVSFRPEKVTVEPGTTVEWLNTSGHTHTVTAFQDAYPDGVEYWASGGFDSESAARDDWRSSSQSGAINPGNSFEHTFEVPGTYSYYCIPHYRPDIGVNMVGDIIVEE